MGTTGSSDQEAMNIALPEIIERVRQYATVPIAVGFGVSNRGHFDFVADSGADGVVIGSKIVSIIKTSSSEEIASKVKDFCRDITLKGQEPKPRTSLPRRDTPPAVKEKNKVPNLASSPLVPLPARFGAFGGQYVPEAIVDCLLELEEAHSSAMGDPEFIKEFHSHFEYINRPSNLYLAKNLTADAGGANIWLKREDLLVATLSTMMRESHYAV